MNSLTALHHHQSLSLSQAKTAIKEAHQLVEALAEQEMDENPLEFVRKESFLGGVPPPLKAKKEPAKENEEALKKKKGMDMNDMEFIDELESVYCDANDEISKSILALQHGETGSQRNRELLYQIDEEEEKGLALEPGEKPDSPERERLPFFKDPKIKFSVWTVIKDAIGKDLTKISLPVYFNMPVSALQMQTATCENLHLLD